MKKKQQTTSASNYSLLQVFYRIRRFHENLKCSVQLQKAIFVVALAILVSDIIINRTQANDAFASFTALILKYSDAFSSRKYYDAFISIGFINSIGITPILIKEVKTTNTIIIVFDNVGISISEWENRKAEIESILNISIASITIGNTNRQIIINAGIGKFDYKNTLHWNSNNSNKIRTTRPTGGLL